MPLTQELIAAVDQLYKVAEARIPDTPDDLSDALKERCAWLARSARLVADTKQALDEARGREAEELGNRFSATVFKEVLASKLSNETRIANLAERLNAALTHDIDAIRSLLAFEREYVNRISGADATTGEIRVRGGMRT
jgi:hypothetical protein